MEPTTPRPQQDRMRTAAVTLGALGLGALYLGYIEVLGSAGLVVHVGMLLLASGGLIAVAFALAADSPRRASALLLLLATPAVLALVATANAIRAQGLPYALVAGALLLLASGAEFFSQPRG
jgi:hypothetical protein